MQASDGHRETANSLLIGYESLLARLKSHGAMLNSVKPELLLDIADFRFAALSYQLFVVKDVYVKCAALAACLGLAAVNLMFLFCCTQHQVEHYQSSTANAVKQGVSVRKIRKAEHQHG